MAEKLSMVPLSALAFQRRRSIVVPHPMCAWMRRCVMTLLGSRMVMVREGAGRWVIVGVRPSQASSWFLEL